MRLVASMWNRDSLLVYAGSSLSHGGALVDFLLASNVRRSVVGDGRRYVLLQ